MMQLNVRGRIVKRVDGAVLLNFYGPAALAMETLGKFLTHYQESYAIEIHGPPQIEIGT